MAFFILSDDLTGAAGVASMVDHTTSIAVNLDRFEESMGNEFSCVVLNLEIREASDAEAASRISLALQAVGENPAALRIDSALRGHVPMMVEAMLRRGDVLVTDTIPEYGRLTAWGETIVGAQKTDIESLLAPIRGRWEDRDITVADSETHEDIDELAGRCLADDLIPVDPGPLVASFVRKSLGLGAHPPRPLGTKALRVAFLIGTRDPATLQQISYMKDLGFPAQEPGNGTAMDVELFVFPMEDKKKWITVEFLEHLSGYDALVLSGGATANYVLEESGFGYLRCDSDVQPLVSSGRVVGGLFEGKRVVLKGGFIGDEKTYKTILDWLRKE